MGKNLIHIEQSDLKRLDMNMREFEKELRVVCKEALANLGAKIVADAQTTLGKARPVGRGKTDNSIATSKLVNSGSVKESRSNEIKAGFTAKYAYWVEFGRRAGGKPPFNPIYEWIRAKHIAEDDKEARSLAFAIRNSIGYYGTKPRPFLRPAYEKNKPSLVKVLKAGAAKIFNKDYSKR